MKKTMSRILTLVLVLAMLVSVVPMALADGVAGTVTINNKPSESVAIGETVSLTATATPTADSGYSQKDEIAWSCSPEGASVSGGSFSATKAGTYTVKAEATFAKADAEDIKVSDTCTITVDYDAVTGVTVSGPPAAMSIGQESTVSASVEPTTADQAVDWSVSGDSVTFDQATGKVVAVKEGSTTITATSVADSTKSGSVTITVKAPTYSASLSKTSLELPINGSETLTVTVKQGEETLTEGYTVVWGGSCEYFNVGSDGKVTGLKAGEGTATAKVTVGEEVYDLSCAVKVVTDGTISCSGGDAKVNGTVTLKPTLKTEVQYNDVEFSFKVKSGNATIKDSDKSSATITSRYVGVSTVTVTATFDGGKQTVSKDVQVSFYSSTNIEVTLKDDVSKFSFDEDDVFSDVEVDGDSVTTKQSLESLMLSGTGSDAKWVGITVNTSSEASGTLTCSGLGNNGLSHFSQLKLGDVVFTPSAKGNGKFAFSYTIEADDDLVLLSGYVTIYCDYAGDISYETNVGSKVTFDEDDFEDFWDDNGSGTLSYITFTVSSRNYGTLYTSSSEKTKVTSSMKFQPNYKSSSSYYDLDTVTYVPDEDRTSTYTDTYEFTAYNTKGNKYYGSVIITVGGGSSTTITSRGVVFGTAELTELLEDTFKEEKGATLNYVTFTLPDADEGKLFYDFSDMLSSTLVKSSDKFYVDPARTEKDLDDVAFVPAAGTYGKVTLRYKAYGASDSVSYSGTLTLTVTEKTKSAKFSDVTATSYSWAADSVDFLYYEGIAQGSGGKYNPATNITRGDFMLMLYRAFLEEDYEDYNVTSNFPDVVKGTTTYSQETYQAVGVAKHLGIAQGTNGKYNPKAYITREEAMTLIYRTLEEVDYAMSYESSNDTSDFKDYSSVASYAKTAISDLIEHGVVVGNNGKINPKSNITRAEMAVILHRVLTY